MSAHLLTDTRCDTCGRSVLLDGITIAQHHAWVGPDRRQHSKDLCTDCQKRTAFYCPYCVRVHRDNTPCEALRTLLQISPLAFFPFPDSPH